MTGALSSPYLLIAFIFNELVVNSAWSNVIVSARESHIIDWIRSATLGSSDDPVVRGVVSTKLDVYHEDTNLVDVYMMNPMEVEEWHFVHNTYITSRSDASSISLSDHNEGNQQEQSSLWIIDSLDPFRAIIKPEIMRSRNHSRELTDLLLSYEQGVFLFESKSLSTFSRNELPSREKLTRNLIKAVKKATRQLSGGIRGIQAGHAVVDRHGSSLIIEREFPMHAIVLVPDLLLLSEAGQYGGEFLREFFKKTGCLLQILDLKELFNMVQAAQILERHSTISSRMMCFDAHLVRRFKLALKERTPSFQFLLRVEH
ncbi:MAG: hypothetical protein OXE57_14430 [Alphaproteobacteria bacterium]|nr:hypothetical protein [Alphaproteobacteria bacterium]